MFFVLLFFCCFICSPCDVHGAKDQPTAKETKEIVIKDQARIKDIAVFEGLRDNQLVGYGLVVGLNGTGDSLNKSPFTKESLTSMLERLGVNVRNNGAGGAGGNLDTKNVAAVMVTATLPPFSRHGARIDATVSAMGDAKSLVGGVLLPTPLVGADGEVYALSQGSIAVGGFSVSSMDKEKGGATVLKGVPTNGRVPGGAIVEKEMQFELKNQPIIRLILRNPDFTTAERTCKVINGALHKASATVLDPGTISIKVSPEYSDTVAFMTKIEQLSVAPDQQAKIVFDDRDGVIVINENVRLSKVAVAHGSLTVKITENIQRQTQQQPGYPAWGAQPRTTRDLNSQTSLTINEGEGKKFAIVDTGATLQDLVSALNSLGCSPRDVITILQAIKQAGALQAKLEAM